MSLVTCGSIHEGHEWFSDYSRGRQEIFMCLAVLLCEQFWWFANGGAKISIESFFVRLFCLSVFSSSEVLGKITSIRSKLPTAACWSREEKGGNCEADLLKLALCWKRLRYHRHHRQVIHSILPVEVLNLIIDSKYQPVDLGNSTIELHVRLRRKKSLQSYYSVDFDFLAFMRFVMIFDITLHNDSSVSNLTNLCN